MKKLRECFKIIRKGDGTVIELDGAKRTQFKNIWEMVTSKPVTVKGSYPKIEVIGEIMSYKRRKKKG